MSSCLAFIPLSGINSNATFTEGSPSPFHPKLSPVTLSHLICSECLPPSVIISLISLSAYLFYLPFCEPQENRDIANYWIPRTSKPDLRIQKVLKNVCWTNKWAWEVGAHISPTLQVKKRALRRKVHSFHEHLLNIYCASSTVLHIGYSRTAADPGPTVKLDSDGARSDCRVQALYLPLSSLLDSLPLPSSPLTC